MRNSLKTLAGILSTFSRKNKDSRSQYIFFKIVDSSQDDEAFILQCINTGGTFHLTLPEIVFDSDILYGLHPTQACFIGIEYSRHIKNLNWSSSKQKREREKLKKHPAHRYGKYILSSQNRKGDIAFVDSKTNEAFLMDPRDVSLSKELIREFDASQAFYIGLLAGFKLNNLVKKDKTNQWPHLKLVKSR